MTGQKTDNTNKTPNSGAAQSFDDDLASAVATLRKGGIILYPTDTIWGIGCDATNSKAVQRVYELKKRADHKAMLVLANSTGMLERYVEKVPDVAYQLIDVAIKPTTIIYDNGINLAPNLLGPDGSIGIRITNERFSSKLCRALRRPIVSTSANISGMPSPCFFNDVSKEIIEGVDYVVNFRRNDRTPNAPSCVIKLSVSGEIKVLRS